MLNTSLCLTSSELTRKNALGVLVIIPNERLKTTLGEKRAPTLRVAPEKAPLVVAYTDVGEGREQDAVALLVRVYPQSSEAGTVYRTHFGVVQLTDQKTRIYCVAAIS